MSESKLAGDSTATHVAILEQEHWLLNTEYVRDICSAGVLHNGQELLKQGLGVGVFGSAASKHRIEHNTRSTNRPSHTTAPRTEVSPAGQSLHGGRLSLLKVFFSHKSGGSCDMHMVEPKRESGRGRRECQKK